MSQSASIDVTKINKEWLFIGKQKPDGSQPKYLSLTIRKNKDGRDQYGNDGMVIQDVPKQFKKEGVRGIILGNWKSFEYTPDPRQPDNENKRQLDAQQSDEDENLPF